MKMLRKYYLLPILLLLGLWSGRFIYTASFEIDGVRTYSLFDDAMISMAYAKNVTQGYGLNWAKFGEPVEGYSNPLWTFIMVPFQLLPVEWAKVSLYFSIFCMLLLMANVLAFDRLLRRSFKIESKWLLFISAFTVGFLYPLSYWTLEGMETGLQALLFVLGLNLFSDFDAEPKVKSLKRLGIVLAAALLLRMDMLFFVALMVVPLLPWLWRNKKEAIKFFLIVGLPMALYMVFRLLYFKDIYPNTYYLKLVDFPLEIRLERGWYFFKIFAKPLWMFWFLIPIAMLALRKNKTAWLALGLILIYFSYSIYIGGDVWERSTVGANRWISTVLPMVVLLIAAGGYAWAKRLGGIKQVVLGQVVPSLICLLYLILVNGILFMKGSPVKMDQFLLKTPPSGTEYHFWNTLSTDDLNDYMGKKNRVAVTQAGGYGYFGNFELVDILGYNDKVIGHGPNYYDLYKVPAHLNLPGHQKLNYQRSLIDLAPDFVAHHWSTHSPSTEATFDSLVIALKLERQNTGGWLREGFVRKD